jgi:protein involved in polysaccharide export with SLBB domain
MSPTTATSFLVTLALLTSAPRALAQNSESSLRAGDSIVVKISGVPAEEIAVVSTSYDIGDNGTINLPYIGEVRAAGQRPSTLQKSIEAAYRSAQIFTHPTIQVSSNKEAPTQVIFVSGEVKTPNRITMSPGMSVGGSITAAGGFTDFASPRRVKLIRNGRSLELDCRQADSPGSLTPVQPGDTIVVPQ